MSKGPVQHGALGKGTGALLRNIILGGQDGLVNVLGIVLGVGAATISTKIVILTGLVATFAESISMAAVAYTSTKAAKSWYESKFKQEAQEIKLVPKHGKQEIEQIYAAKGFKGQLLNQVVRQITADKDLWLETMMREELGLSREEYAQPLRDGVVVGLAALVGSLIPLVPFFFVSVYTGIWASFVCSTLALFIVGVIKAKITIGTPWRSGVELALIGILAALAGYGIGQFVGLVL